MAVIYMPPNPNNFGGALGSGVGQGVETYMQHELARQEQQQKMQRQMQALHAVQQAPSREAALGILTTPGVLENPQELSIGLHVVDALHPPKDTTPVEVKGYDHTGKEIVKYVPRSELPRLDDPATAAQLFGPGSSMSKPNDLVDLFDGGGKYLGKRPLSERQPGEVTDKELALDRAAKKDKHTKFVEDERLKADKRTADAGERAASASERMARAEDIKLQKTYAEMVAGTLNVKKSIGFDGALNLDFEGDKKKEQAYHRMLAEGDDLLKKNKGNVLKAVAEAQQKYFPDKEETPAPAAAPAPKPKSGIDKVKDFVKEGLRGKASDKPKDQKLEKREGAYVIKNDADFGLLDKGDEFIAPDGKRYKKK